MPTRAWPGRWPRSWPIARVPSPRAAGRWSSAITDLVAAAVRDGAVRDDVDAGAVMMALHGTGAAHDRPC
ncbi:hypothetical protein ABZ897_43515 [Nonomuraea sp. NPDC046802]|uniref:SbtR family transcriptional regulator n=1 Tax=Nonomuraea sp. NPDC046802 TaxID=3154919 RepID=UPI0034052649